MLEVIRPGNRPKAQQPPLNAREQGRPEPTLMGRVIDEPIATQQPPGGEHHLKGGDGKIVHRRPGGDVYSTPNARAMPTTKEAGCPSYASVRAVTQRPQRRIRVVPDGDGDARPASPQLRAIAVKRVHPTITLFTVRLPPKLRGGTRRKPTADGAHGGSPTRARLPCRTPTETRVCRKPHIRAAASGQALDRAGGP